MLAAAALVPTLLPAQDAKGARTTTPTPTTTTAPAPTPTSVTPPPKPARTAVRTWSEPVSRDLFSGCDTDADDRLDLFEASEALDTVQDPKNSEAFARLDTDRDGFLSWPEFDQHFWSVTQLGTTFHVRPSRQHVDQSPENREARAATKLQIFLMNHDENGDGALDPTEVEHMVVRTEVPPNIAAKLRGLDRDGTGKIEEAELAPWFESLRGRVPEATPAPLPRGGALLPPWHDNDTDQNGKIDAKELAATLRRLDPALARWADALLKLLDRDKDGVLTADELPAPRKSQRETAAANPTAAKTTVAGQ